MPGWDENAVEKLLLDAQDMGYPFQGYRYLLEQGRLKCLGHGSYSSVYELEEVENPERRYAVKVIGLEKGRMTSEKFYLTSSLQRRLGEESPYIIRILGMCETVVLLGEDGNVERIEDFDGRRSGRVPDGWILLQFLLMELQACVIEKDRLWDCHLSKKELSESVSKEIFRFAKQVGQAIQTAHRSNVLHRDIKLENIFWNEEMDCYQLGDFGIAKHVDNGNADTVVYTDGYGAPEIERRLLDHYDVTADIYSFGICLYLLLNELRFPGSDGYYALQVQYDPKFVFPAPVNADPGMTKLIRKACSYYPENRFQSMEELLAMLDKLQDGMREKSRQSAGLADLETETYREGDEAKPDLFGEAVVKEGHSRHERILEERKKQKSEHMLNLMGKRILMILIMTYSSGFLLDSFADSNTQWLFCLFPFAIFVSSALRKVNEWRIAGVVFTVMVGVVSFYRFGGTAQYILLYIFFFRRKGEFALPASIGVLMGYLVQFEGMAMGFSWLWTSHLSWIVLMLIFMLARMICVCQVMIREKESFWEVIRREGVFDMDGTICLILGACIFIIWAITPIIFIRKATYQFHFISIGLLLYMIRFVLWKYACKRLKRHQQHID